MKESMDRHRKRIGLSDAIGHTLLNVSREGPDVILLYDNGWVYLGTETTCDSPGCGWIDDLIYLLREPTTLVRLSQETDKKFQRMNDTFALMHMGIDKIE